MQFQQGVHTEGYATNNKKDDNAAGYESKMLEALDI